MADKSEPHTRGRSQAESYLNPSSCIMAFFTTMTYLPHIPTLSPAARMSYLSGSFDKASHFYPQPIHLYAHFYIFFLDSLLDHFGVIFTRYFIQMYPHMCFCFHSKYTRDGCISFFFQVLSFSIFIYSLFCLLSPQKQTKFGTQNYNFILFCHCSSYSSCFRDLFLCLWIVNIQTHYNFQAQGSLWILKNEMSSLSLCSLQNLLLYDFFSVFQILYIPRPNYCHNDLLKDYYTLIILNRLSHQSFQYQNWFSFIINNFSILKIAEFFSFRTNQMLKWNYFPHYSNFLFECLAIMMLNKAIERNWKKWIN